MDSGSQFLRRNVDRVAVDANLIAKLRDELSDVDDVEEKGIVGGVGFMVRGKLFCGVMGDELLFRVAKRDSEEVIGEDSSRPMAMAGRQSKGWVLLPASVSGCPAVLRKWVKRAIASVATRTAK